MINKFKSVHLLTTCCPLVNHLLTPCGLVNLLTYEIPSFFERAELVGFHEFLNECSPSRKEGSRSHFFFRNGRLPLVVIRGAEIHSCFAFTFRVGARYKDSAFAVRRFDRSGDGLNSGYKSYFHVAFGNRLALVCTALLNRRATDASALPTGTKFRRGPSMPIERG